MSTVDELSAAIAESAEADAREGDDVGVAPRLRGFVVDAGSAGPLPNVMVTVWSTPDEGVRWPVGVAVTDRAGYVSVPVPGSPRQLEVCLGEALVINVAGGALTQRRPAFIEAVPRELALPDRPSLPSVIDPDVFDFELSPQSMVAVDDVVVGDDDCLVPQGAFAPARDLQFARVVAEPARVQDSQLEAFADDSETVAAVTGIDVTVAAPRDLSRADVQLGRALLFRQQWWPVGHSLGDISYSLALAPGESVDLAVMEWTRTDRIARMDDVRSYERLRHDQRHDRTIDESVEAALRETQWGFSLMGGSAHADQASGSATVPIYGVPVNLAGASGNTMALGGGIAFSSGSRDVEASSSQEIHDRVRQGTSVVRGLASTVIVQATQAEISRAETRTVTNYNRCHTLTVQYYEVLRNCRIETRHIGSLPVVLVPFVPFTFDAARALRWRSALEPVLLDQDLADGFGALARIRAGSTSATTTPTAPTPAVSPRLTSVTVRLRSGAQGDPNSELNATEDATWGRIWIYLTTDDGVDHLVWFKEGYGWSGIGSDGSPGQVLKVGTRSITVPVTAESPLAGVDPTKVTFVKVVWYEADGNDHWYFNGIGVRFNAAGGPSPGGIFEVNGEDEVHATPVLHFDNSWGANQTWTAALSTAWDDPPDESGDDTTTPTPTTAAPTGPDDRAVGDMLVHHLNDNQAYYNRAVWVGMDPGERRILLERALGSMPWWSLVSERPVAAAGRWVAFQADAVPVPATNPKPLVDIVALPSRGLFAEAHLGHCSACEVRDVTRTLDWTPRTPPRIADVTLGPQGQTPDISPTALPSPVVAITQAPGIPDPTGLANALGLLGRGDLFRDMSGLNQVGALLDDLIAGAVPDGELAGRASQAKNALASAVGGAGTPKATTGATTGSGRSTATETDPVRQFDRLKVLQAARDDAGLLGASQAQDSALAMLGGESAAGGVTPASAGAGDWVYWSALITHTPPADVVADLAQRNLSILRLANAWGDLNLDYYPVRISALPTLNGQQLSAEEFLKHIRLHFDDFVDPANSSFPPLDPVIDGPIWESDDPLGAVINIQVNVGNLLGLPPWRPIIDQSLVVCSLTEAQRWIFTTARGGPAAQHPVSGNRMWAIDAAGSDWILYTMGADRATSFIDWTANAVDLVWAGADELWQGFQAKVAAFVNDHDGQAAVANHHSRRYSWNAIQLALDLPTTTTT